MANNLLTKLDQGQVIRSAYDEAKNRLRVDAEVEAVVAPVEIVIDAASGDNIAIADETGTNYLGINPDGSINVVIDASGLTTKNIFGEVPGVVSGVTTVIASYTAIANTKLLRVDVGGENVATYSVYIAGVLQAKKYTYFTILNESFEFTDGLPVNAGDLISVEVVHNRPDPGNFNTNILVQN